MAEEIRNLQSAGKPDLQAGRESQGADADVRRVLAAIEQARQNVRAKIKSELESEIMAPDTLNLRLKSCCEYPSARTRVP